MDITFNKTKIIATVGPACNTKEKLLELAQTGVDVFRLNFSHGTHDEHLKVIQFIREINDENNLNLTILQDLQGPKIRTREVENGSVLLEVGKTIIITTEKVVGTAQKISTTYDLMPRDVKPGDLILIDDGKIELKVIKTREFEIEAEIIYGGVLKSKKGINLPKTQVSTPSLTEKDTEDLMFGLEHDVDWIALSFVRNATDMLLLKHLIHQKGKTAKVIAKIEKPEALKNIDEIIAVSDGLMVARGDLGVEINPEEVPTAQKMIVQKCKKAAKPVIIATQVMESMITNPRPTRAETNDIANAVIDGADAIMLSAETASGLYPILTVQSMAKTIQIVEERTEKEKIYHKNFKIDKNSESFYSDSLVAAACILAKDTDAKAIVGMTHSGYTAFRIAGHRPEGNIFIFTSNKPLLTKMNLIWGVRGFYYDKFISTDDTFLDIQQILVENNHLKKGDAFVQLASMPMYKRQRTNTVKLIRVE